MAKRKSQQNLAQLVDGVAKNLNDYTAAYDAFLWLKENGLLQGGTDANPEELAESYAIRFAAEPTKVAFAALKSLPHRQ